MRSRLMVLMVADMVGYSLMMANDESQAIGVDEHQIPNIMLTTESPPNLNIIKRIDVITAECVYGMNIFRDVFAGVRDIVGGRSGAQQNVLRDARETVLKELRKEAHSIGANAVIAVDLDYNEISGGGKSGMLMVVASGTAVVVEQDDEVTES